MQSDLIEIPRASRSLEPRATSGRRGLNHPLLAVIAIDLLVWLGFLAAWLR